VKLKLSVWHARLAVALGGLFLVGGVSAQSPSPTVSPPSAAGVRSIVVPVPGARWPGGQIVLHFEPETTALTTESVSALRPLAACLQGSAWESVFEGMASTGANPNPLRVPRFHLQFDRDSGELSAASKGLLDSVARCARGDGSYVVLLSNFDGTVGRILVQGRVAEHMLSQRNEAVLLDGTGQRFIVSDEQVRRDFGSAVAALPLLPEQFVIRFDLGRVEMTAESRQTLQRVVDSMRARQAPDVSVIGHTDSLGSAESNEALSLKRSQWVADQLRKLAPADMILAIEAHGEGNPAVPTPDETNEPRNRRVEITVR
jgi:peptidoglycan-associated lipoprotein